MKKALLFSLLGLAFAAGHWTAAVPVDASVKPAVSYSIAGPNIASETDAYAAVTGATFDFVNQRITINYAYGNATTSGGNTTAFTPGTLAAPVQAVFNLATSNWSSSTGANGTLSGATLTAVQTLQTQAANAIVNPAESFAVSNNLFGSGATNFPWNANLIP